MKTLVVFLASVGLLVGSCRATVEDKGPAGEWTVSELKALRGKTREQVRGILGDPGGMYTIDSKGRWHYPHVQVLEEGSRTPKSLSVMVYFSKFGEQRVTIVEVREKF